VKPGSTFLLLLLVAAACGSDRTSKPITESREISVKPGDEKVDATSRDRFGDGFGGIHGAGGMGAPGGGPATGMAAPSLTADDFAWKTPAGWSDLPSNEFRIINLRPAKNPEADCYVSAARGGVLVNVNRWRGQFGAPPLDAAAVAALPKQKLLGIEAVRVEVEGTFSTSMPGAAPVKKENFKLLGLVADAGEQQLFVKMTGPKALVDSERSAFDGFVASLKPSDGGGSHGATSRDANRGGGADPHAAGGGFDPARIRYDAPAGWVKQAEKPMRVVTFKTAGATACECVVSVFGGDAGGLANNVQRWRGQMGLSDLPAAEIAKLPKLTVLGREATVVDLLGKLNDSMNHRTIEGARFLGVICPLDGWTLFVKLTGPEAEVTAAKEAFLSFCQSLRQ
jgi:hypothetical protein